MINQRKTKPFITKDLKIWQESQHCTNAVMRAFGNSVTFPYGFATRDFSIAGKLKDCSLLYLEVADDSVIDIINSFVFSDLIFSRMTGETAQLNPNACLISKYDVMYCYEMHQLSL